MSNDTHMKEWCRAVENVLCKKDIEYCACSVNYDGYRGSGGGGGWAQGPFGVYFVHVCMCVKWLEHGCDCDILQRMLKRCKYIHTSC
mmetsp:Transcript_82085/g.120335  ORF Transcript_82085/g.120335 Transcript_82085/m.120335 type:complete len:87 (+) Transcript_82085:400-660(+)